MPNAQEAIRLINAMRGTNSRTEKEALITELVSTEFGQKVIQATYDPFVTYGLTPEKIEGTGPAIFTFGVAIPKLLARLADRTLSGNAAKDMVKSVMGALDPAGAELLFLILSKDLKCGIAETSINAVMPKLVPIFSVMRAHKYEEKRIKAFPVPVEPKLDGFRYTFLCRDGNGGFFSRSGLRQASVDHLVEPMIELALKVAKETTDIRMINTLIPNPPVNLTVRGNLNFMVDGEMIAGETFNESSGALRRESEQASNARFNIFDIMSYADFDASGSVGLPYEQRRELVEEFVYFAEELPFVATELDWANSHEEIITIYERHRAAGREGAMVKIATGLYDKKKSYGWLKIKAEETEDLPIVGAFPGEPNTKYANCLGGVIVQRMHEGEPVLVRVGGGFTDAEREQLWLDWQHDVPLLELAPDETGPSAFKLVDRLSEVEFHEITPDGSLRHPRHKRFRDDKRGEVEDKEVAVAAAA